MLDLQVVPQGLRHAIKTVKEKYNSPIIHITENGMGSSEGVDDDNRIDFIRSYMSEMLKAVNEDGCNVQSYIYWSILDNLEWIQGFTLVFFSILTFNNNYKLFII